ncbi:hypothetical protein ABIF65_003322 [Bradyrhizobium japonicum]|jgi:hypothetical protein|uniref:hypothetical protein n=1 Tax=Bradyrhizobium TaxID=374 RepID=UPI001BAC9843|nr:MULTISPECIES: hypothetical protein [Bradyrhizobium]MBR0882379.1 hypothetical protein [Bradyrhizobium liaoningense]MBR1068686.1 hypothetical protein [Bradyrhizobium liaoningense]MCP1766303.1 hypothetical protein [Bradyrhizobium japonicum]MCP1779893.1 hypothetical protein [Bradyrhizobium japonicum]MCP1788441.1 hypothetical protein [Bradyrhizobium japonicum]
MDPSFTRKKQMSEEHFAAQPEEVGRETTPKAITQDVITFSHMLGSEPEFVPVRSDAYGLFGWCSDGVEEKVRHDGGGIVYGWTIWEWTEVLLTAEFHAVWEDKNGDLIDITPKPQGEASIVFVADRSYAPGFNFHNRPHNRRYRVYQPPDFSPIVDRAISQMKPSQLRYETRRADKAGMSLQNWLMKKAPADSLASLIDSFISTCDKLDQKTDALSGNRNHFSPDSEYLTLTQTKIEQLKEIDFRTRNRRKPPLLEMTQP